MRNRSSEFPTRSHTNRAVQSKKMARCLKFHIYEVEGLCYPCSENKDTDQLRSYREADLRLCFRICESQFSHNEAHIQQSKLTYTCIHRGNTKKSLPVLSTESLQHKIVVN